MDNITFKNKAYTNLRQLGKGKGGYSYLVTDGKNKYVLKQIHHEPCSYYTFGDKLQTELDDYDKLRNTAVKLPKLLDYDREQECILKEYIEGMTVMELVELGLLENKYIMQMQEISEHLKNVNLNIDYYPTNFIIQDEEMFYIDYECNPYMEEWSFEKWGIQYWKK